jgi:hypothetical protein
MTTTNKDTFTMRLTTKDKEVIQKCLAFMHQIVFYDSESIDSEHKYRSPDSMVLT